MLETLASADDDNDAADDVTVTAPDVAVIEVVDVDDEDDDVVVVVVVEVEPVGHVDTDVGVDVGGGGWIPEPPATETPDDTLFAEAGDVGFNGGVLPRSPRDCIRDGTDGGLFKGVPSGPFDAKLGEGLGAATMPPAAPTVAVAVLFVTPVGPAALAAVSDSILVGVGGIFPMPAVDIIFCFCCCCCCCCCWDIGDVKVFCCCI